MAHRYLGVGQDIGGTVITNSGSPSGATDLANKGYVDNLVNGLEYKNEVRIASTAALTLATGFANGATIDGVAIATNDRILIKNQSSQTENGIYTVNASGAPTRAQDADATAELNNATVYVTEGTTLGGTQWTQTTKNPTVGSSNIVFAQVATGTTYTASLGVTLVGADFELATGVSGAGLTLTSGVLDVVGDASITVGANSLGLATGVAGAGLTLTTGVLDVVATDTSIVVAANGIAVNPASGSGVTGPGLTISSGLKVDSSVARIFRTGTHASTTSIAITHGIGNQFVQASIVVTSTGEVVEADMVCTSTTVATFTFASAPTANTLTFVIVG